MNKVVNPSFILLYTPQIFDPRFGVVKPEGSLGLIYLASALRDKNFQVSLLDATVGNDNFTLEETFYREEKQPNGMIRVGMEIKDILKEVECFDVVGLTSIFTAQTRMVEDVVSAIKENYPERVIGRVVVVHQGRDDMVSQPSGAAGKRTGCGPIIETTGVTEK